MKVAVIGGGLAGAAAAFTLREGGAEVSLWSRGAGASAFGGGTFDFAAAPLAGNGAEAPAPAERVAALLRENPHHPYHRVFGPAAAADDLATALEAALGHLDRWLQPGGLRVAGRADRALRLCESSGAPRLADAALASVAAGDLDAEEETAWVAVPGLRGWDAHAASTRQAAHWSGAARPPCAVGPTWPSEWTDAGEVPGRLAARLDDPGALPTLREALRPWARAGRTLLLPPVLGLDPTNPLFGALRQALEGRVAECVGVAPLHLPGARVQRALEHALDRAGVLREGASAGSLGRDAADGLLVQSEEGGEPARYDAVVLATGRFVGGGIAEGPGGLEEGVAGLPLFDPATQTRVDGRRAQHLTRPGYAEAQPLFRIGVVTDAALRPLGLGGQAWSPSLFAAGDVLGGFDPARDRSGHGVALLTGIRAGQQVLRTHDAAPGGGSAL